MKRPILAAVLSLCTAFFGYAQGKLDFKLGAQYIFDNHEFDPSGRTILNSETIHFYRFTPSLNWKCAENENWSTTIHAGVDLVKNAGVGKMKLADMVEDTPVYLGTRFCDGSESFMAAFGIYPRRLSDGYYSELLISEETIQSDFNMDGMFLQYRNSTVYAELGLDWMGRYGEVEKERFQVFTSSYWRPVDFLSFGLSGSFYHYAGSVAAPGVVDNHIVEPFVLLDLSNYTFLRALTLRLGGFYSYQRDRLHDDLRQPIGTEVEVYGRLLGFELRNSSSYTGDFLPFYNGTDSAGNPYGDRLYRGSRFYNGFYDRLELSWAPHLSSRFDLKVAFRFHYNADGFLGSEQRVSLYYNL